MRTTSPEWPDATTDALESARRSIVKHQNVTGSRRAGALNYPLFPLSARPDGVLLLQNSPPCSKIRRAAQYHQGDVGWLERWMFAKNITGTYPDDLGRLRGVYMHFLACKVGQNVSGFFCLR